MGAGVRELAALVGAAGGAAPRHPHRHPPPLRQGPGCDALLQVLLSPDTQGNFSVGHFYFLIHS